MRGVCLVTIFLLSACASAGTKVDPQTVSSFVKGRTTVAQAEEALGEPNGTSTTTDGSTSLSYTYAHSSVRASTFIPLVGAFVGGTDTKTQSVVLRFDRNGLYQGAASTTGNIGATTGLGAE
jgi:hypothetical protein